MNKAESILQQYEIGQTVLNQLFTLNCTELRKILSEICIGQVPTEFFKDCRIEKLSANDIAENISMYNYDSLCINAFGIKFRKEHGDSKQIVTFNKFFTLNLDTE
jgi:hypothetical protein